MSLSKTDRTSWLQTVWDALHYFEQHTVVSGEDWDDICTAMAWIGEDLGIEFDEDGFLVDLVQGEEDE